MAHQYHWTPGPTGGDRVSTTFEVTLGVLGSPPVAGQQTWFISGTFYNNATSPQWLEASVSIAGDNQIINAKFRAEGNKNHHSFPALQYGTNFARNATYAVTITHDNDHTFWSNHDFLQLVVIEMEHAGFPIADDADKKS